jgi:CRISPR-associated protein Cas2
MFAVLIVEALPNHLEGYVGRLMQRLTLGVFVGTMSTRVVDELWERVCKNGVEGRAILVEPNSSEVGYSLRLFGCTDITQREIDGLIFPIRKTPSTKP